MKNILITFFIITSLVSADVKALSKRPFLNNPEDYTYTRGTYLIVLKSNKGILTKKFVKN